MDIREKTFADEATKQLDFLRSQFGFAGPDISRGTMPGAMVNVRYHRGDITIEACLVFWYMGEEYVATARLVQTPGGAVQRTEIANNTAHTGYQMRRALRVQADAVRDTLPDSDSPESTSETRR